MYLYLWNCAVLPEIFRKDNISWDRGSADSVDICNMREQLFEFIQDAVYKVTGKKGIFYDTDFVKDLQLTSFDVMNLVCIFEDQFDIEIPSRDVWKLHQVEDVIEYMIKKGIDGV